MPVVDADTHVDENEETWAFLLPEHERFRPLTISPPDGWVDPALAPKGYNRFWSIDGALRIRRNRDDVRTGTTVETRELTDVGARLRDMDRLGVDAQVMYPTLFLTAVTAKPDVEYALVRSYNRWLGAKSEESGGRLRWVVVPPMLSIEKSAEELEWGRAHGACGVFKRGVEAGGRSASDPYFFPLYEAAQRLDMPICIHIAAGDPAVTDTLSSHLTMYNFSLSPIDAFISMVTAGLPAKFPSLRVGFIETMSSWVPYAMAELQARHERSGWMGAFELGQDLIRQGRFYVACQTHEDLPYVLKTTGEDNLILGTDYTHADHSAEIEAHAILRRREDLPAGVAEKIARDNPTRFYGLE